MKRRLFFAKIAGIMAFGAAAGMKPRPSAPPNPAEMIAAFAAADRREQVERAVASGVSVRIVANRFSMSPHTVRRIRDAMEEQGQLTPIRVRIEQRLDHLIKMQLA